MTGRDDARHARWVEGTVRRARGEVLDAPQEAAVEAYEHDRPEVRDEEPLWEGIAALGDPADGEVDEDTLLAAVMERLDREGGRDPEVPSQTPTARRRTGARLVVVFSLVFAAAVMIGVWGLRGWVVRQSDLDAWTASKAEMSAQSSRREVRIETPDPPPARRRVLVPEAPEPVVIEPPTVEPEPESETRPVRPVVARPSAEDLIVAAQRHLAVGETQAAIGSYQLLISWYPRSVQADTARISLGRLMSTRGRPDLALQHYDQYLSSGRQGLAEEARYGRIRAFRALGRQQALAEAIDDFLARHPSSVHARRLARERDAERRR